MLPFVGELPFHTGPLILVEPNMMRLEINEVFMACKVAPPEISPDASDDEWEKILMTCLPEGETETEILASLSHRLSASDCERVAWIAMQLSRVLEHEKDCVDGAGEPPHWCLVPADYRDRMLCVFGVAQVPFAWVKCADALPRFSGL